MGKLASQSLLARFRIETDHAAVPAGVQHDIFVDDQAGSEIEREGFATGHRIGFPDQVTRLLIQADQPLAIMEVDVRIIRGQGQRRDPRLL